MKDLGKNIDSAVEDSTPYAVYECFWFEDIELYAGVIEEQTDDTVLEHNERI